MYYYCNCSYYCNIVILYTMCQSYHLSTLYHPLLYNYILVWLKKWPPGAAPAFNSNQLNIPSILGQEFLLLSVLCYCDNWPLILIYLISVYLGRNQKSVKFKISKKYLRFVNPTRPILFGFFSSKQTWPLKKGRNPTKKIVQLGKWFIEWKN